MQKDSNELKLHPLSGSSVVDNIIDQITQAIIDRKLKPGDKLPTEFELAKSLHAGRNSVREAIKVLTHFRVLRIERANGTFVADSFQEEMLDPLVFGLILQKDNVEYMIGLRQVFDTGIITMVIENSSIENFSKIETALQNLKTDIFNNDSTPEQILQTDCTFHTAINESLKNPFITQVAGYIDRITIPSRVVTMKHIIESHKEENFLTLHQHIIDIIKKRRTDMVPLTVSEHYQYWREF